MTKDRIVLLDSFRGLAVLGILLCNVPDFSVTPDLASSFLYWPHGHAPGTASVWYLTQVVFQQRFYTLFSMLFGVSMFLVGGDGSDRERTVILFKRLVWLLAIGLVHGLVIWNGDILATYAVVGLLVIWARGWSARRLLWVGAGLYLALAAWDAQRTLDVMRLPQRPLPPQILAEAKTSAALYAGTFRQSLAQNAKDYWDFLSHGFWPRPTLPLHTASLMLIGLGLHKLGLFSGKASKGTYQGLAAVGLGGVAILAFAYGGFWIAPDHPRMLNVSARWLQSFTAVVISLGYVGLLTLAARSRTWRAIPDLLAPAGQMAFTNYLTQSLIMTAIFYGGRGPGLFGQVDRPLAALLVVAVWILQILWSRWWMARFTMGPLEWLWRRAYRGPMPLRRERAAVAVEA